MPHRTKIRKINFYFSVEKTIVNKEKIKNDLYCGHKSCKKNNCQISWLIIACTLLVSEYIILLSLLTCVPDVCLI